MSGDCPECDRPLLWVGMGWEAHTDAQHALYRHTLLRTIADQLMRTTEIRRWELMLGFRDEIGVRWRNGVLRHRIGEYYTCISRDAWREVSPETWAEVFREQRAWMSRQAWEKYGVEVNPATWFHKIYDGRGL